MLWARRSWFEIDGDRLLVQEVSCRVARMSDDFKEAPLRETPADPHYKPAWKPQSLRDTAFALGRSLRDTRC